MDRRLIALSALGWSLALAGCGSVPKARPSAGTPGFALPPLAAAPARGQKPEPKVNMLDIRPEDPGSPESHGARVRAMVNGQAILEEEVQASALQSMAGVRTEADKIKLLNAKLNELIERELVLQDAEAKLDTKRNGSVLTALRKEATKAFQDQWHRMMRASGQTDEDEFRKFLRAHGMPPEMMQRQFERNFMAMEYAKGSFETKMIRISHADVLAYYQAHARDYMVEESIDWQDLFVAAAKHPSRDAARKFAESLAARARQGADFAKLVQTFDNGDSSLRPDGAGIGKKPGEISPPEAQPVVLGLKQGEVGGPIEMEGGFHIVRVAKRTKAGRKPFDGEVQRRIRDKLRSTAFEGFLKRFVRELRQKAVIDVAEQIK